MVYDINGNQLMDDVTVEEYYEDEMIDTIAKVRDINDEPAIVFPCVTDIHRYKATVQTFEKMIANITKFTESVKCDFIANLGDTIEGDTSKAIGLGYAFDDIKAFHGIGVPLIYAQGNHDNNIYSSNVNTDKFNIFEVFKSFFVNTKGITYNFAENGTDYYVDFPIGIRVVVLNSCNVKNANNYAYGSSTASWLTNTALNTDNKVILLSHLSSVASQVWNNNHGTYADGVQSAITSFVNNGGTLISVSGHSHIDVAFVKPWLSVMNVCQKFEVANTSTSQYQMITGYVDGLNAPVRTANTYTEDAWTVCVLKPNSKEFDCIRFGAGADRYFHYEPIAPTTLSSRLSNVTWSSSDTSVATVSNGVVTGVASGTCGILAKDSEGNYECWTIKVQ